MLSKTKRVFTTHLPVLCSIASRNYYNGKVEGVETFITICAADEGGGMEIYMTQQEYESKLDLIRLQINTLTNELWNISENQNCFSSKNKLQEKIISDILYGYGK